MSRLLLFPQVNTKSANSSSQVDYIESKPTNRRYEAESGLFAAGKSDFFLYESYHDAARNTPMVAASVDINEYTKRKNPKKCPDAIKNSEKQLVDIQSGVGKFIAKAHRAASKANNCITTK